MHVLYNYDNAIEYMESSGDFKVVITEGFEDCMSFESQGIHFAVSVDAGAPNEKDTKIDGKLECVDNSQYLFELAEVIYIATDNDANGRRLRDELVRRVDAEKVRIVDWGKYKDANEALMYDESLQGFLDSAREIKMDGVYYAEDVYGELDDIYENGLPKGTTTHLPSMDAIWTWRISEVNLWTGYQNEGKSTFLYYISMLKAMFEGWKFALFTPENFPAQEFYEDVIHMYAGKTTDKEISSRMSRAEFEEAKRFVNEHFFLMYPEDNASLDSILERAKYLVKKKGIRGLIIDPYNTIEHDMQGLREDLYISKLMGKLKKFSVQYSLSSHLVAHQNKPKEFLQSGDYPKCDPYQVKGGGTFADKVDNVLSLQRPFRRSSPSDPSVVIESHKIKKKKLTGVPGDITLYYDWRSNRYMDPQLSGKSPMEVKLAML
jgi:twinkle protein